MAVNYPNGIDTFNEPSLPEYTPLSSAGTGTRAHVEHHHDLGQAVVALQTHAAKRGHDHSGDQNDTAKGARLSWLNSHEAAAPAATLASAQGYADTDNGPLAVHHTLATNLPSSGSAGQYQAAPGNHTHPYSTITGITWLTGTTAERPTTAPDGTVYYAIDTNQVRVYNSFYGGAKRWVLLPMGAVPICRLRQTSTQTISQNGTVLQWQAAEEDTFGFFSSGAPSSITVSEPGLYHVAAAMQWDESFVPDTAFAIVLSGGQETTIREQRFLRGNGIQPGFSQTLSVSGNLRITTPGTVLSLRVKYSGSQSVLGTILSFIDPASKVQSRIDVTYVSP